MTSDCRSPINIVTTNSEKRYLKCDLKCNFQYKYSINNPTVENKTKYLKIRVKGTNSQKILYNDSNYNVQEARLYSPSLHKLDGKYLDGELIIKHTKGSYNLFVCILLDHDKPEHANLGKLISNSINYVSSNSVGPKDLNIPTFSFDNFLSNSDKFYSYKGSSLFWCSSTMMDIIVLKEPKGIFEGNVTSLRKIVKPDIRKLFAYPTIYFNNDGIIQEGNAKNYKDGITIDCQPIGTDKGKILETRSKNEAIGGNPAQSFMEQINEIKKKGGFKFIMGMILTYILFRMGKVVFNSGSKHINNAMSAMNEQTNTKTS